MKASQTVGFVPQHISSFMGRHVARGGLCASVPPGRKSAVRPITRASIEQEVSQQMKEAMKSRDAERLKALKGIRAAFLTALKQEGAGDTLSDEEAIAQLRKLAKMRKESITMFTQGGRTDMAADEQAELDVIEHWLPKLAGKKQTKAWAQEAIEKTGASKPGDMGKVMGMVMRGHKQEIDGNILKEIVTDLLA